VATAGRCRQEGERGNQERSNEDRRSEACGTQSGAGQRTYPQTVVKKVVKELTEQDLLGRRRGLHE
jgi:hypothetical protein